MLVHGYDIRIWYIHTGSIYYRLDQYKKVIFGGQFCYLGYYARQPLKTGFVQRLLTTAVVNTLLCSARNQHDRERPANLTANMKRLLTHLRNLPLIATDLGLSDILLSLSPT